MLRRHALILVGCFALSAACGGGKDAKSGDGTLLTPYLAIGDTLAADSLDTLPTLGAQVVAAAEGKESEAGVADIIAAAGRVGAQDIATARTAYKKMSRGMITHLKANAGKQTGLMIVHCTMTFGGDGAHWVQKEGSVMNPYEGAMMLHCGDKKTFTDELEL